MPPVPVVRKVDALQLDVEGLLRLLGGDDDDRERFFEILKGITTPAEMRLASVALDGIRRQAQELQSSLHAVHEVAAGVEARA